MQIQGHKPVRTTKRSPIPKDSSFHSHIYSCNFVCYNNLLLSLLMGIQKILIITKGTISRNLSDVTVFLNAIFIITVPFKILSHF